MSLYSLSAGINKLPPSSPTSPPLPPSSNKTPANSSSHICQGHHLAPLLTVCKLKPASIIGVTARFTLRKASIVVRTQRFPRRPNTPVWLPACDGGDAGGEAIRLVLECTAAAVHFIPTSGRFVFVLRCFFIPGSAMQGAPPTPQRTYAQ